MPESIPISGIFLFAQLVGAVHRTARNASRLRIPPISTSGITLTQAQARVLNKQSFELVEYCRTLMRGIIVTHVSPEEVQAVRHLRAVEGYADLGMFEEAAEELRELDPSWFQIEPIARLQLRVFAGLSQHV